MEKAALSFTYCLFRFERGKTMNYNDYLQICDENKYWIRMATIKAGHNYR